MLQRDLVNLKSILAEENHAIENAGTDPSIFYSAVTQKELAQVELAINGHRNLPYYGSCLRPINTWPRCKNGHIVLFDI